MRESSLVLSTDVLQVKQVSVGDVRHRIVICTPSDVDWPDEKSVRSMRDALVKRLSGVRYFAVSMPMKSRRGFNILLVINLPEGTSKSRAIWYKFETLRVVIDQKRLTVAKSPTPHKGRVPRYTNQRVAIATTAA